MSTLQAMIERSAPRRQEPQQSAERCGLCALPLPPEHRHVIDLTSHELHCACQACSLLFDHSAAGGRHYRLLPRRRLRLAGLAMDDLAWRSLGIPVEMAFFVRRSEDGRVTAFYPSPAGITESSLALEAWDEIEACNPPLAEIEADVEALLVNGTGGDRRAYIVGLEDCYRLVAVVRQHWHGLGGGDEVWVQVGQFFAELDAHAERIT